MATPADLTTPSEPLQKTPSQLIGKLFQETGSSCDVQSGVCQESMSDFPPREVRKECEGGGSISVTVSGRLVIGELEK